MTKKGQQKSTKTEKEVVEKDKNAQEEDAEEVNSGFANYLRSSTGLCIV
jgi:hypothetical protein